MKTALLIIDVQNEYFASANGKFDQFNLDNIAQDIADYAKTAEQNGQLIIGIQHLMQKIIRYFPKGRMEQNCIHRSRTWRISHWCKKPMQTAF